MKCHTPSRQGGIFMSYYKSSQPRNHLMSTVTQDQSTTIVQTIEDTVEYLCQEMFELGTPMSGETMWLLVSALADAKGAQFRGECV